jgi:hypothetical protein
MPDANGNFKGMRVNAAAWERIFGAGREHKLCRDCTRTGVEQRRPCAVCFGWAK